MKSINTKALRNMVEKKLNVMVGAQDAEQLRCAYNDFQAVLKQYYDVCLEMAEYNDLLAEFAPPTVEYEPADD